MVKRWMTIWFCMLFAGHLQAQSCFARVSLDRRSVYVQQPFKVTITVMTSTWYTAPLDFENIQIPSAFVLPFDRTMPGMFTVNGKQYAGLQFYYIVFPYKAGSFAIPSIDIIATTPPEGSSESRKVKIHTTAESFTVKPVPDDIRSGSWFVAKNVNIEQHWNKPLKNLKVGDIIERTITIDAGGTLPQFIPPLTPDSLGFANAYLQDAELLDERTDYDANGRLTQSEIFLLEKPGNFEFPSVTVTWWNPLSSREYKRSTRSEKISVAPNPDLGMVASIRDSLQATVTTPVPPVKKKFTLFGLPGYEFLLYALALGLLTYLLFRLTLIIIRKSRMRWSLYLQSERHAFRQLIAAGSSVKALIPALYRWWDRVFIPDKTASIVLPAGRAETAGIEEALNRYFKAWYKDQQEVQADPDFQSKLKIFRETLLHKDPGDRQDISTDQQPFYNHH